MAEKVIVDEHGLFKTMCDSNDDAAMMADMAQAAVPIEDRFRQLHQLLNRSKFYSKYLSEKIDNAEKFTSSEDVSGKGKSCRKRSKTRNYFNPKKYKLENGKSSPIVENKGVQPKLLTGTRLRPYQLEGYNWLRVLYENGVNGILGDEMGLGKTVQCIALIAHIIEMGVAGPFLICAPLSTLHNWICEFEKFTDEIPTILYHGSIEERKRMIGEMKRKHNVGHNKCYPVVITSYKIVINDCTHLRKIDWKYLVVDEGHRIKNYNCLLLKCLKSLHSTNRLLLTGTPLQNNLSELWSLLNFLMPEIFDNLQIFHSWFNVESLCEEGSSELIILQEQEKHLLATLHEILSPFLLRRLKQDVELTIPPKREFVVYAPMTSKQQQFYRTTVNHTIRNLVDTNKNEVSLRLGTITMALRKSCNHPYLIEYPLDECTNEYKVDEELITSSGKMLVLDILLKHLKRRGHKVLVFSQLTSMLDILEDFCYMRNYEFCRLDGSTKCEERQEQIMQFNKVQTKFLFLVSTRAGGLGINLTAADTAIIFDSDWNPQCDLQAMDRCHRFGQTKTVVVVRLVTENTIDHKIIIRAASKRKLEKMVIHKDLFKRGGKLENVVNPKELLEMLKANDHDGVIHLTKDKLFTEEEIEMLLDRSFTEENKNTNKLKTGRVWVVADNEENVSKEW